MRRLRNPFTGRLAARELVAAEAAVFDAMPPMANPPLRAPARSDGRIQILAADDNATNRLVLSALLLPLGVELVMATDGADAVRAYQEGEFDLVLMDIQMPNLSGVDATKAIRAWELQTLHAATPIVAVTANVMAHEVAAYLAAGMDSVIAKPIDPAKLFAAVQQAAPQDLAA